MVWDLFSWAVWVVKMWTTPVDSLQGFMYAFNSLMAFHSRQKYNRGRPDTTKLSPASLATVAWAARSYGHSISYWVFRCFVAEEVTDRFINLYSFLKNTHKKKTKRTPLNISKLEIKNHKVLNLHVHLSVPFVTSF